MSGNRDIIKLLIDGLVAHGFDNMWLLNKYTTAHLYFAVAVGLYASQVIELLIICHKLYLLLSNGKTTIDDRIIEIGAAGSASVYVFNKYVLKNDFRPSDMYFCKNI